MRKILFMLFTFMMAILIVSAKTGGNTVRVKDIATSDNKEIYYESYDILEIREEDIKYLKDIDFSKFQILQDINIYNVYLDDFKNFNSINESVEVDITFNNSVVDLSSLNASKYSKIGFYGTYIIDSPVYDNNVNYKESVNADNNVIEKEYEDKINEIAEEIYNKSDKTVDGIIKEVTVYVLENMEFPAVLNDEGTIEYMIFEKKKGACAHYAHLESVLLNKLGIFTLSIYGWTDDADVANSTHAWVNIYKDGKWYSLDPSWLEDGGALEYVKNGDYTKDVMKWYMKPLDDEEFNNSHHSTFTSHDLIPKDKRVSKSSIIKELEKEEEIVKDKDDTIKELEEQDDNIEKMEEKKYEFIEGANQEYTIDSKDVLSFRINVEYNEFIKNGKVYIDDKIVNKNNYVLKEGSTIIEFTSSYADELKDGKHKISILLNDKIILDSNFVILIKNPETLATIPYVIITILFILVLVGMNLIKKENKKVFVTRI